MCRALIIFTILTAILVLELVTCCCFFVGDSVKVLDEGFFSLLDFDHGKQHHKESASKSESKSPIRLVSLFKRLSPSIEETAPAHQEGTAETSLEGSQLLESYFSSNGLAIDSSLEMHILQTTQKTPCILLFDLSASLAVCNRQIVCSWSKATSWRRTELPSATICAAMGVSRWPLPTEWTEVSQTQSKSTEEISARRQRQTCRKPWAIFKLSVHAFFASWIPTGSASATTCWTSPTLVACGHSLQCCSDACHEHDAHAEHAAITYWTSGSDLCAFSDASSHFDSPCTGVSAVGAAQLFAEEIGGSPTGCSTTCPIRVPEAGEKSHQGLAGCREVSWGSEDDLRGSHSCLHPTHQHLEVIPGRSSQKLDRVCQDVRRARTGPSNQDFPSKGPISRSEGVSGSFEDVCGQRGHGDQRRRRFTGRDGGFDVSHADHREHADTFILAAEAFQGCRGNPSGGPNGQAATNRRSSWRRSWKGGVFQLGWLSMTLWYTSRKPDSFSDLLAMKWSHSIRGKRTS